MSIVFRSGGPPVLHVLDDSLLHLPDSNEQLVIKLCHDRLVHLLLEWQDLTKVIVILCFVLF